MAPLSPLVPMDKYNFQGTPVEMVSSVGHRRAYLCIYGLHLAVQE